MRKAWPFDAVAFLVLIFVTYIYSRDIDAAAISGSTVNLRSSQ
jgi:uncharacterized membrane protein